MSMRRGLKRLFYLFKNSLSGWKPRVVLLVILLLTTWFASKIVLAEHEKNIYIFPSTVSVDGWGNGEGALRQDLSKIAAYADFSEENSAHVKTKNELLSSTTAIQVQSGTSASSTYENEGGVDGKDVLAPSQILPVDQGDQTTTTEVVNPNISAKLYDAGRQFTNLFTVTSVLAQDAVDQTRNSTSSADHNDPVTELVQDMSEDTTVCRTVGITCHTLQFVGFGVVGDMTRQPLTNAAIELSLAARGGSDIGAHDRILVRAYMRGKWEIVKTVDLGGELSNERRDGYLDVPLTSIRDWSDLATLKVAVEYLHESDADTVVYLDGVWLNVNYQEDLGLSPVSSGQENIVTSLNAADAAQRKERKDHLDVPGRSQIIFSSVDNYSGANIEIKSDRDEYHPLQNGVFYANVTNNSESAEEIHLQFHLPGTGGNINKVERWVHDVPFHSAKVDYGTIGYFCKEKWESASTTEKNVSSERAYTCTDTNEVRVCDTLNEDATNCLVNNNRTGVSEEVEFRDGWQGLPLVVGSYTKDEGILTRLIQSLLSSKPDEVIPSSQIPAVHSQDTIVLEPGQTTYLRVSYLTPFNSKGELFVEAAGESGAFGLKKIAWNGSWNAKKEITINQNDTTGTNYVLPIALDRSGEDFWKGVATSGDDIRFVDESGLNELPFALAEWDYEHKHAVAWVRVPNGANSSTTRINLYYGDHNATNENDLAAPLRTDEMTSRYVVFGPGSQQDQKLVVTALDSDVHVRVGSRDEKILQHGEQLIFADIKNGEIVSASGAISGVMQSVGGGALLVPTAFSGQTFALPKLDENSLVGFTSEDDHADISVGQGSSSIDIVPGSIVSSALSIDGAKSLEVSSTAVGVIASASGLQTPFYPATALDLYGIKNGTTLLSAYDGPASFTIHCERGTKTSVDGRLEGQTYSENICQEGDLNATEALRISDMSKMFGVHSEGNPLRGPLTFLPRSEMQRSFILAADAEQLVAVCAAGESSNIGVFDQNQQLIMERSCEGNGANPGKVVFSYDNAIFRTGFTVRTISATSSPVLLYAEINGSAGALWQHRLVNVWGMFQSRGYAPINDMVVFSDETFVVPGEHRIIDVRDDGKEIKHVNDLLLQKREFSQREKPVFHFLYHPQSSGIMQGVRGAFGIDPFTVSKVTLVHSSLGELSDFPVTVAYGKNGEWEASIDEKKGTMRPGKYTLKIQIDEGDTTYEDSFDFYWGLIAVNYDRSVFTPGDNVHLTFGAISNNGNTICDANLKTWITTPGGFEQEIPVSASGKCNGNNVVDVPDYDAHYLVSATGTYQVKVVRIDQDGNLQSQVTDSFSVVPSVPYVIERVGPTRIYPIAHYKMTLRVRALQDFSGKVVERVPNDFIFIDRGNADLERDGDFITASWGATLKKGDVVDYSYVFDAPNVSPYLYLLGPATMQPLSGEGFTEARAWQIASDAAGNMLIFWDSASRVPTGWSCISCQTSDVFYRRFAVGSSTYGVQGGTATNTPTASATVYPTTATGVGPVTTNNTTNSQLNHSHSLVPDISSVSNYPSYYELRVLRSTSAGEPASIPTGAVVAFDVASSSLPSNWYRYAEMDGRFPMGASSTNVLGGSNTHSHTATGTTGAPPETGLRTQGGVPNGSAANTHTHTLSATSTDVLDNQPPYREMVFARLTATSAPSNYMIGMWDDTPPNEWTIISSTSTALENYFLKASTTYGGTGGALTHTHRDIISATTSAPSTLSGHNTSASNGQAPAAHTHSVDITGFSAESNIPPYIGVIFAKRLSGVSSYTQQDFWFFANTNASLPTDPWPVGGSDLSEDDSINSSQYSVEAANVLRIRMNIAVQNSTSTVGRDAFKLQYVSAGDCAAALNWSDVAPTSSTTAEWRGYDNAGVVNNTTLGSYLLASSTVAELYVEQNNSTGTPNQIGIGEVGEYDWVVQANSVSAGTTYCFRMVKSDGTPFDAYTNYPQVLTNASPNTPTLETPYDNEKISTTSPTLLFNASDNEGDDLDYEVQISASSSFATTLYDKDSTANPELFNNADDPVNKAPFYSGNSVNISVSPALTNGSTYWWRVRSKDSGGSNSWGSWSSIRSFTIDTSVSISTWFQTTRDQFNTDTFDGTESTQTDQTMLITGSTTGWLYSSAINFADHSLGTAWGSVKFGNDLTHGTMKYQVEYQDATSGWALIPDADLSTNSTGFTSSPVSILSVNSDTYPTIRLRGTFTNSGGTPKLNDWTVEWAYNVNTPTQSVPFDNSIAATTSPYLEFTTTDPQSDALVYQVAWSTTSPTFTSSSTRTSNVDAGFRNITTSTNTSPFISGNTIRYVFQPSEAISASTTVFWKVRAIDPGGGNTWSFWSDVHSFTSGTWAKTAIWYQTVDGQFDTDTLTSVETYGSNRIRVATSTREAMVAYAEGNSQTPKYRIWSGTGWTTQADALSVGSQMYWTVLRASPLIGEYALGTLGTNRDVNVQLYNNGAWGNQQRVTGTASNYNRRGFDLAYEQVSGNLMAVACDGDADPTYVRWNGTSWFATGTVNISSALNCEYIRLASKPNSNELILLERNTGSRYEAQVWDATTSSWGNAITLGSMTEFQHEGMAVEYENSGSQGMIVTSNGNTNSIQWRAWNGTTWSATATQATTDDLEWANLKRGVATDTLALCYVNNVSALGVLRWDGTAWNANTDLGTGAAGATKNNNREIDCDYETTAGRTNNILAVYSTNTQAAYRNYVYTTRVWSAVRPVPTSTAAITTSAAVQTTRAGDGKILGLFLSTSTNRYDFSYWASSTWSSLQTLESNSSITAIPYAEPFYMAAKNPATLGTIIGTQVNFSDGGAPGWKRFYWTDAKAGASTLKYQLQYLDASSSWSLVPDSQLTGNSAGFSTGPVTISTLDPDTYSSLRLKANATCVAGVCPYLDDWTIEWAQGVNLYGTANQRDLSSVATSGTVAVAVNGTLQAGKTGTIGSNGQWQIDNVTIFPGNIVTVFIQGAATATRAVNIAKYVNAGDMGGFSLNWNWVTLGSASSTYQDVTLTDIARYDNSISANNDIIYDVTAGGDLNTCNVGVTCSNSGLYVVAGTNFRPSTSTAKTINTYDLRIAGSLTADANTIKVGGDWRNLGGFTANTSTIVFNSTSTTHSIDQTGAATSTFYQVTFGESGNVGTSTLSTGFVATGTVQLSYGALSPGNATATFQGDFTIGASGVFKKGNATTTFSGSTAKTLTDNTSQLQDLGNILVDGTTKTLNLGSSIKVTNLTIGSDDTLDAVGANTVNVLGNWYNNNVFTPRTGTVSMNSTTTGRIMQGASSFYNLTFNGAGGLFNFIGGNATTTNDFTIATGTPTLATSTLAVGGSFNNTGGAFTSGTGIVRMTAVGTGKTIRANGSSFYELQLAGSGGGWTMSDTNATTTASTTIILGTLTLPSGTLAVGDSFVNSGGSFVSNSGTLRMTSSSGAHTIKTNGSSLGTLQIGAAGTFSFPENYATTTGGIAINAGTLVFPYANLGVGGSFVNSSTFTAGTSTVVFAGTSGSNNISPGNSSFSYVTVNGSAQYTVTQNATTTNAFSLYNSNNFTVSSGVTLAVGGAFTNLLGGASTTWTGTTLFLTSGTSYTINTKNQGGDLYGTFKVGPSTQIRSWSSSSTVYTMSTTGSLYSQNHASTSGALNIYGNYSKTSGTDYWSYATDFDGTALGGSSRAVSVLFGPSATTTYTGATLQIVGGSTATTTVDRETTGNYAILLSSSTINAAYYQMRNIGQYGLQLYSSTTVTSLHDGDFQLAINGGSMMTVSSSTIDTNPALQIYTVKFATSSGITAGYNVTATGTASSYWRFKQHFGNYAGENFDNDPTASPGNLRWDDSNFTISISGTVYSDAGVTPIGGPTCDNVTSVVRVKVDGAGSFAAPCNSVTGAYTVSGVSFAGDTVMTVYLDTNGGSRAAVVTRSAVADLTGINLYKDRVIVREEDVFPITIANMDKYDNGDDSDIPFTATVGSPNTLVVKPDTEFWVWAGKTFTPGGNVTTQSGGTGNSWDGTFHVDNSATFTAVGTEAHSVGGKFVTDSGATFTAASSTFTFTATTTGKSITALTALTFYDVVFSGTGGNWSVNQNMTVGGNLTMTAGTVSGASNITVLGTNVTGNGVFAMTGGTFTLSNGGTFGGTQDWAFNNITFSGAGATTTKTASSTVIVGGVLTVSGSHVLTAGTSTTWNLSGVGTPFVVAGTFARETSVFKYTSSSTVSISPQSYYRLQLSPSTGTPIYTISAGILGVLDAFTVGGGTSTLTVNATTNDPTITLLGDLVINPNANFIASDSGTLSLARDYTNLGTFTSSSGTITFIATSTGRSINPGSSSFGSLLLNSATGGWTVTQNATTSSTLNIALAQSFTVASSTTFEVDGSFANSVGGSATTWTGATLYLNSGSTYSINTKSTGNDLYHRVDVGANTKVSMWNSAASTTNVNSSGSLYSQDHNSVDGSLYIWGSYTRSSGNDYWDYATDFDGTVLGTSSSRIVNVRFAPGASVTLSGGSLEIVGTSSATTTLDIQSSGNYGINFTGGSTTMKFASMRNADASGINISGSPIISAMTDNDFELAVTAGELITVTGGAIDANPLRTFYRNRFATSTGVTSGFNVKATGVTSSAWRFNLSYGNLNGEAFDSDPGGDPGYIIWDDSAANITISGNVYSDEGVTPIGGPTCDGVTQNVRLKVQGAGSYTSACNAGTGAFSIANVIFNPGDTLTLYLDTNGGARAVNVSADPSTNILNMHLYQNRVIVRHEDVTAMSIARMVQYDSDQDADIPFNATVGSPNTLVVQAGTGLIVWDSKTFSPGGNITLHANAGGASYDGTFHMNPSSTLSSTWGSYLIGGGFFADSGATVSISTTTMTFTASTTGRLIAASSTQTFGSLTFSGTGGGWDIAGVGTTTNDMTLTAGAVTFPSGTLVVNGSLTTSGGTFTANGGTLRFSSTAAGKTVSANGSQFNNLEFAGTGGSWTMSDTNATSTGTVTISRGAVTLPTGTLAVRGNFDNQGGTFTAGAGTLKMTQSSGTSTIRFNGSSLNNLTITGTSTFTMPDSYATTTGDVYLAAGTTTLPYTTLAIGGSLTNNAVFVPATSTVLFAASSGSKTINPGSSSFYNLAFSGAGTFTISGNATATNNASINAAGGFTLSSGLTLAVANTFTNIVGGAPTTWTGSTLSLYSGTSYTINTKTLGGDTYDTLRISSSTQVRSWNSSASTVSTDANSSYYSQNNAATPGALNIYGNYVKTSGTDYWSYATDFDGVALGGSSRQVNVRIAPNATSSFTTSASLQIIGSATASTTIDRLTTGSYAIGVDSGYLNASYYTFKNMNQYGLKLTGTTTLTTINNGDFELDQTGGTMISIASSTLDQNASSQYFTLKFATTSGVNSGANITVLGTTTNSISLQQHYGNYAGESYDNDGIDGCGSIRWTDSSCLFVDQNHYRFRNDNGGEGVPNTEWYDTSWTRRKRITVTNTSTSTLTNAQVKLNVTYDSDMQTNFNDIRFTDSSGTTSISHWIQDYVSTASSTVWVKVPSIPASGTADIFMYYGNSGAISSSSGTSTFIFFDDFEDSNITEYTGDTSLFNNSSSFNYERNYGLAASAGNTGSKNTTGIAQLGAGVGQGTTFRFFQYIDMSSGGSDEPCVLFGVQSPLSPAQNYAVCLQPFGQDKVVIAKDASYNGRSDGSTLLVQKNVTYTTGWYETNVDWLSSGRIDVSVYNSSGSLFATTTATSSTYSSGGIGFTFWGMHGGWDIYSARNYYYSAPTVVFGLEQQSGGASWKVAQDTALTNQPLSENLRLRFTIKNSGTALPSQQYRLQVAPKGGAPNCESVSGGNYSDVPTTSSGCGTSVACMTSSSQFSNNASTTQLLSLATGFTFVEGQILEDPSNQTGNVSLNTNESTEVEYNFQMSQAYSVQPSYCFRSIKSGVALDNYSKVAELTPLYPPSISNWSFNNNSNIALTEGATTQIYATGTVTDYNGYSDIIAASSTMFRSGVSNSRYCSSDQNNCYQIATTSCLFSSCSGNSCDLSCSANLQYFADPTDAGSTFASQIWDAFVDVWDTSGTHTTASSTQDVYTLKALSSGSAIDYGSVTVGTDTGATDATSTISNTGNTILNLSLLGSDLINGVSRIGANYQKYATTTFTYSACTLCNILSSTTPQTYNIGAAKPTTTTPLYQNIYWGLSVPTGVRTVSHFGSTTFSAI